MRAATVAVVVLFSFVAAAEPQPTKVDITPFRAELLVFADSAGNTYVLKPATPNKTPHDARLFFGTPGKPIYEQMIIGRSVNGPAWSYQTWAPRIAGIRPAYFDKKADGSYVKMCGDPDHAVALTQLTGDKAKQVLDKTAIMTEYLVRRPHVFARDDRGIYYYVDRISAKYGGKGFRVFMGKKGAMKQLPVTDVATDAEGEVFATKSGDIRLDLRSRKAQAYFVRGEKKTELITLDVDANSVVIFSDLGIYHFLGTLCDT